MSAGVVAQCRVRVACSLCLFLPNILRESVRDEKLNGRHVRKPLPRVLYRCLNIHTSWCNTLTAAVPAQHQHLGPSASTGAPQPQHPGMAQQPTPTGMLPPAPQQQQQQYGHPQQQMQRQMSHPPRGGQGPIPSTLPQVCVGVGGGGGPPPPPPPRRRGGGGGGGGAPPHPVGSAQCSEYGNMGT